MVSHDIEIPTSGGNMPAYLALAAHTPAQLCLVLLQEIFGVNANMREVADGHAARGFHVVVPDLFWRQEPGVQLDPGRAEDRTHATRLMNGLDTALAVEDALAAARHVRGLPDAPQKLAAVGYCLGGKLAYLLAGSTAVDAAVSYYGVGIQGLLDSARGIRCPLLLHIAQDDHLCPPPAQKAIADALAARHQVELHTYPGVGHAFARRASAAFNAEAASRADGVTDAFLQRAWESGAHRG